MKRIVGIAFSLAFVGGVASGGSIGGTSGNGTSIFYNPSNSSIRVLDRLVDYIVVIKRGVKPDTELKTYSMDSRDFDRFQDVADTRIYVNAKGANNSTRSYRVQSGEENQVELIDRRLDMRNGVTP